MTAPKETVAMIGRVFISHASQDREVAQAVCDALEARGVPCWIAPRDITPGKEYAQALYDAIVECRALLLVLSAHAAASAQVRREVDQAARDGDPIIAFRIDDCDPGPGLEIHIGRVDWLAPPSLDLAAQIGRLASLVEAQLAAGPARGVDVTVTSGYRAWRGYVGVLRRLLATWTTVLVVTSGALAAADCAANVVAFHFAHQDALADAARPPAPKVQLGRFQFPTAVREERISPFREEEPAERIVILSSVRLMMMLPAVFVWLAWLCSASLTLEHAGMRLRHAPARAPGRLMRRLATFRDPDVLRELWCASLLVGVGPPPPAEGRGPRRLRPFTFAVGTLLPLTLFALIVASEDSWSDRAIFAIAIAADLGWLAATALCLLVLGPIEKRLRSRELDLTAAEPAPLRGEDAHRA